MFDFIKIFFATLLILAMIDIFLYLTYGKNDILDKYINIFKNFLLKGG